MQSELKIAMVQKDIVWQDAAENRLQLDALFAEMQPVDLIVLPEMFATGFSMLPHGLAECMQGATVAWMQQSAKQYNAALVGSLIIEEEGLFYNRLLFVTPEGSIEYYDKRHSFTLAGEHQAYTSGTAKLLVHFRGWNICPLICYDLRFPVWSRNTEPYDLLLYVANWPMPRIQAWNVLLKARAIENMSYCIGVNRVGVDANKHVYSGDSMTLDYEGNEMTPVCRHQERVLYASLKRDSLHAFRKKLPFLEDQDRFKIY